MSDKDGGDAGSLYWVGILLSALGSLAGALGNHLVKFAHRRAANVGATKAVPTIKSPFWWAGMFCIIVLNVGLNVVSYAFAAQSLLAPLAGLALVWNVMLNPLFLKENIGLQDVGGTVVAVAGTVLCSVFGSHAVYQYSLQDLEALYRNWDFIVYMIILVGLSIILVVICRGIIFAAKGRYSWPILGGIIGAVAGMFAKSAVEVVSSAIGGANPWGDPLTYVFIVTAIGTSLVQLFVLNSSLAKYEAKLVVPVYQSSLLLNGILNGYMYFQEAAGYTGLMYGMFFLGVVMIGSGVVLISMADHKNKRTGSMENLAAVESGSSPQAENAALLGNRDMEMSPTPRSVSPNHTPQSGERTPLNGSAASIHLP